MYGSKKWMGLECRLKWYKCDGIYDSLPNNCVPLLEMAKILVLVLITAATAIASRHSPGSSAWQVSNGFGAPSGGFARFSGSGWASSGGSLGRLDSNGDWHGTSTFGSSGRSRTGNGNGSPSSGWSQSGFSPNGAYGGNSYRSSSGWNDRFSDSNVIESFDSSNGWNSEYLLGSRSNNGWQSSGW